MLEKPVLKALKTIARPFMKLGGRFLLDTGILKNITTPDGHEFSIPNNMHWVDLLSLYRGEYEASEIKMIREHFRQADCIVELGSNIGVVSRIAFEEKLSPKGKMICVEPNPKSYPALQKNMGRSMQHKSDKMVVFENAAIGKSNDGSTTAEFFLRNNLSSGLSSHLDRKRTDHSIDVNIKSLSDILKNVAGSYSLIADIEGAEIDLIQQEPEALDRCDQIMIELHEPKLTGRQETPEIIIENLKHLGFHVQGQSGNSYCLSR